ncbi:uncharacterized protein FRV6_04672 [Fusarium oxysporum]|uniref:Uncharacterized protein n=1 Tax=Fusarium oxysporum TaxID=5507 RepID=A0A2H3SYX3_FUSOX|nr:uncharacterized protein FRV6_04672 [Fusarium oxysporum]
MAPGRRSRDTSGRFAASDDAFSYHTGKVKVKIGQSARNALGAAENVLRLAELVKKLLDNEITTEPSQEAKSILTTMGDIKGLTASVTAMKAEQVPLPSNHLGSALRVIHRSGGSTRNGVMKFLDTDIAPDLRQKAETILKTMGGIQGLTMSVAAIVAEQAPEPASDQFGSAVRVIHDSGGSGSARGTSELFNDSPTPTDIINFPSARKRRATETTEPDSDEDLLAQFDEPADQPQNALTVARPWPAMPYIIADSIAIGNGRRAIYSLIAADELMVFLSEDTAQIFGHLLLILRNKVSQSLPLSAATRMAGISKSLVPVFDMPLYLPNPDSTALASYISSIADMRVFNNLADARTLTRETANLMKSQDWQPSAGLAMQYNRIITPGEGFFPMQVIADKLTHLGQSWKPLITRQGRN